MLNALLLLMPLQVVPILRAGLVLLEQAATLLPAQETYHLGYVRDDETLQVSALVQQYSLPVCTLAQPCRVWHMGLPMIGSVSRFVCPWCWQAFHVGTFATQKVAFPLV